MDPRPSGGSLDIRDEKVRPHREFRNRFNVRITVRLPDLRGRESFQYHKTGFLTSFLSLLLTAYRTAPLLTISNAPKTQCRPFSSVLSLRHHPSVSSTSIVLSINSFCVITDPPAHRPVVVLSSLSCPTQEKSLAHLRDY